jgi:hypothetical protein
MECQPWVEVVFVGIAAAVVEPAEIEAVEAQLVEVVVVVVFAAIAASYCCYYPLEI